jgi:glyoxylase-like metal-dependent hydrolase (beta-lactamase superfamily II)
MIHEILPVGPLQCNCSVFGDEQTREAIVIDPGDNIDGVLAILRKHQLKVKAIEAEGRDRCAGAHECQGSGVI